ncbi:hypothetical protein H6F88_01890 [Oculatella sp. FACHB-28]|uniref:hypothetical protein n=1 Tax=Oculatella sp. FACHB-28 TaxID=2692845 RepID=UPI0016883364|nr:hypothetical protein [Oculatella sp. FACHB-28]MBD2054785.1 hypothetical protein [Oculatella sp. FACHB-28]
MMNDEFEALIDAKVESKFRELLASFVSRLAGDNSVSDWVDTNEACKRLGYPSPKSLYASIDSGLFRLGKEVRDRRNPGSQKAIYQFHVPSCEKRLSSDPSKRRGV